MVSDYKKVIAIIQARMGSTRLPGKVMLDLAGQPMLMRVVSRTKRAVTIDKIVVATTTQPADDIIVHLCDTHGLQYFRGSEEDVLDRYYRTASAFQADIIVRITSDCPLIDPGVVDMVVQELLTSTQELDYVSNSLVRSFPQGLDVEAIAFNALERAWNEDNNPAWREHVTPYIYRHPENFKIHNVASNEDFSYMRWTVDTREDLAFIRKIYKIYRHDDFCWQDVINLLNIHPEWLEINKDIVQKRVP